MPTTRNWYNDTNEIGSGGGGLSDGDLGDITVSDNGTVLTIDDDAVTYAKMQNVSATDKVLGRSTAGAGNVEEIACTAAGRALLDDADAAAQRTTLGFVEVSGADDDIWQKKAGVWTNRTLAQLKTDIAASDTAAGVSELATASEVTTGTDAARVVTPDALAGSSIFGVKSAIVEVFAMATNCATGDGKKKIPIPSSVNGMNLVSIVAYNETAGTTGTMDIQIARDRGGSVVDVLTTKVTIDSTEKTSATAATAAVINTSNDDVATGDFYRVDVDAVHTTPAVGLWVVFNFQLP